MYNTNVKSYLESKGFGDRLTEHEETYDYGRIKPLDRNTNLE